MLNGKMKRGIVLTKYGHGQGYIPGFEILEAGHPIPDENTLTGTEKILEAVTGLSREDTVIFLVSGGGSALFEKPMKGITLGDIISVTDALLKKGADIIEMNTVRKHLSAVKGGRFALYCYPAKIYSIILSDVIDNRIDAIASGPACADSSTSEEAVAVLKKYDIAVGENIRHCLEIETPKSLTTVRSAISGSVESLCSAAARKAALLGYEPLILTTSLCCEAREAGIFFGGIARSIHSDKIPVKPPCAVICGGETIVYVTGKGKGGRNQEMALAAAAEISGMENTVFLSIGSDGTDGPTDAAGGIVDGTSNRILEEKGISVTDTLKANDSYEALKAIDSLILTGPTGTNVNDLQLLLIRP